jgi:hypothetical protein
MEVIDGIELICVSADAVLTEMIQHGVWSTVNLGTSLTMIGNVSSWAEDHLLNHTSHSVWGSNFMFSALLHATRSVTSWDVTIWAYQDAVFSVSMQLEHWSTLWHATFAIWSWLLLDSTLWSNSLNTAISHLALNHTTWAVVTIWTVKIISEELPN